MAGARRGARNSKGGPAGAQKKKSRRHPPANTRPSVLKGPKDNNKSARTKSRKPAPHNGPRRDLMPPQQRDGVTGPGPGLAVSRTAALRTAPVVVVQQISASFTPELRSWILVEAEKELDEAEAQLDLLKRELAAERERRCAAEQALIDKDEEAQRLRSALALQGSKLEQAEESLLELRPKAHSRREEARRAQWALHQIKQQGALRIREGTKMASEQVVTADAEREQHGSEWPGDHGELRQQIECCGGERVALDSPHIGVETELAPAAGPPQQYLPRRQGVVRRPQGESDEVTETRHTGGSVGNGGGNFSREPPLRRPSPMPEAREPISTVQDEVCAPPRQSAPRHTERQSLPSPSGGPAGRCGGAVATGGSPCGASPVEPCSAPVRFPAGGGGGVMGLGSVYTATGRRVLSAVVTRVNAAAAAAAAVLPNAAGQQTGYPPADEARRFAEADTDCGGDDCVFVDPDGE
eukprot:TRINITY_DN19145_c0_g1_i1.p1 TRINITY_DN19145_c0_g1~~TRINITY_DN19145_c0_g1_i1.p1  ORF type:complete len:492 (+),score=144.79 TRINITY_DN19145_c0_g1_i1:75-1478(+)